MLQFVIMSVKTKRAFTVNEKLTIISEIEHGSSQASICTKMKMKKSTVSNIWKNREKIKKDWIINDQKKKMRLSSHPQVDEMLFKWFQQIRGNNFPVNGPMLQFKAEEFGRMIGDNFKCSAGWLDRFKKRHKIVSGKICEESTAPIDRNITNDWISHVWPVISDGYSEEDIFNADETGIFFRLMPDKTHEFMDETCNEGQMSKERITAMLCVNASGKEKRKLLIIGKYRKPKCFKNVKSLPSDYCGNKRAWMTSEIFEDYLKDWDRELIEQNRKVLLLVDNCPAHPQVSLSNIKLHFFPSSTTPFLQPMNQGIIWSLKEMYRKQILLRTMELQENHIKKSISLLDSINLLSLAWESIPPETICNCFRLAELVKHKNESVDFDPEDDKWLTMNNLLNLNKFYDYVNVDNKVVTEELPGHDIINEEENAKETDEEQIDDEENFVRNEEALCCIRKLQNYFQQEDASDEIFSNLNKIQIAIQNKCINDRCVQMKITDFFGN